MARFLLAFLIASSAAACASAPLAPPPPPIAPPGPTFEQKMAWMLRLEDQRKLRDPAPEPPPPPPPAPPPVKGKRAPAVVTPPPLPLPPPPPDLVRLLEDPEARIRRRAALAVGRVGLADGVDPLVSLLADPDAEVRQIAAFALGLLGDRRAREPLVRALADPSPLMKGSAAEALGLIGDPAAAAPIGAMVADVLQSGALAEPPGDDADMRRDMPAAAFRLGLYALVRLKAYEPLAAAVLDPSGQPRTKWWPVAFALQRLEDKRALNALLTLAKDTHPYTRAFAVKGLGALKDRAAIPTIAPLASGGVKAVAIEAIRALGRIGDPAGGPALLKVAQDRSADVQLRVEAVTALGATRAPGVTDFLLDLLADSSPELRAAALRSTATLDSEDFVAILSGLDPDPIYTVRAALASVLATLPPEIGLPRLSTMINDSDQRVVPSVLAALVKLKDPKAPAILLDRLKADDPAVRAAAAAGLGDLKPAGGAQALAAAYKAGQQDGSYIARAAALVALGKYGSGEAMPMIRDALTDKDWAVRVRAAALMKELDPSSDAAHQIRPAPTRVAPDIYQAPRLVSPTVSTQAYLETDRGTIQIDLAVLEAPLTVENFVTLARAGFFNGLSIHRVVPNFVIQSGDPRGDSEGGPNYTIRDELNELPYVRGSVGMALDWPDTGGSQFFITHSPQPHLDAKYTLFGRVTMGMEVVDAIQQGDVIRRVRIWDGVTMSQ